MSRDGTSTLKESDAEPLFQFMRGKITMRKQSTAKLAADLPNRLGKVVVDETGLNGLYDFDLEYRDDGPKMLTDGLKQKYGLVLTPPAQAVVTPGFQLEDQGQVRGTRNRFQNASGGVQAGTRRQAPVRRSLRLGGVSSTRRAFRRVAAGRGRDRRSPLRS